MPTPKSKKIYDCPGRLKERIQYRKQKPNYRYSYHNDDDEDNEDDELKNIYYIPKRKSKRLKKKRNQL